MTLAEDLSDQRIARTIQDDPGKSSPQLLNKSILHWQLLLVITAYLALLSTGGPSCNFPLNDDWLYGPAIEHALATGKFSILTTNAFNIPALFAGFLASKLAGFSYDNLHVVSISFSLLGALALYAGCRQLNSSRTLSALATATWLLNPMTMNLSLSFMTDMPALALNNVFFLLIMLAVRRRSLLCWSAALLALFVAISSRQTAAIFAVPLAIVIWQQRFPRSYRIIASGLVIISTIVVYKQLESFMLPFIEVPQRYQAFQHIFATNALNILYQPLKFAEQAYLYMAKFVCYSALLSMPLLLLAAFQSFKQMKESRIRLYSGLVMSFVVVLAPMFYMALQRQLMPYSENLFEPPYFGSYCLIGHSETWENTCPLQILTFVTGFFAVLLVVQATFSLLSFIRTRAEATPTARDKQVLNVFLWQIVLVDISYLFIQSCHQSFDRYYTLAAAPIALLLVSINSAASLTWRSYILPTLALGFVALYGGIALQDQMNFNRTRWAVIRELERSGISSMRIDGGVQYNMLVNGKRIIASAGLDGILNGWSPKLRGATAKRRQFRWWPINREDFIVAKEIFPHCQVKSSWSYWSPIAGKNKMIYVLCPIKDDSETESRKQ